MKKTMPLDGLWRVVYRWSDGSTVSVCAGFPRQKAVSFRVQVSGRTALLLSIFDGEFQHRVVEASSRTDWPAELERKILGFVLELGAERWESDYTGLLYNTEGDTTNTQLASYPRFVDDDRWAGRYEEARRLLESGDEDTFLGVLRETTCFKTKGGGITYESKDLKHWKKQKKPFSMSWGGTAPLGGVEGPTIEAAVDEACRLELLVPLSGREAWEAEHVERGTWVLPSAEEVELYQMLGEPLPFWWGVERCREWLEEQP